MSEIGLCSACKSSLTLRESLVSRRSACKSSLSLRESLVSRRGIISKLVICCTVCDKKAVISDPYAPDAKQLNARSVMVMQAIGRGKTSLQSFCGLMDILPPVAAHSYKQHNKQLAQHSMEVAASNMLAASTHLHRLHGVKSTDIIDIACHL